MHTPPDHLDWQLLARFELGQLGRDQWLAAEQHLAACALCAERLDTIPHDELLKSLGKAMAPKLAPLPAALAHHQRYRVLERIGGGGMGEVYKAEHLLLERFVAIKVIRGDRADHAAYVQQFLRETKILAALAHPNIVAVYDAEEIDGDLLLVTEYVEGESLTEIAKRCPRLPVDVASDWIRQAAAALQYIHEQGIVHRDLKPSNLMVTPQGTVKLLDFGLAGLARDDNHAGRALGTPAYLAPEQFVGGQADVRSDLYSLGCIWYQMLVGRQVFPGDSPLGQLTDHQSSPPPDMRRLRADVPRSIRNIIDRLLQKNPRPRFQSSAELIAAIDRSEGNTDERMKTGSWPLAVAGICVLAMLISVTALSGFWRKQEEIPPNSIVRSEPLSDGELARLQVRKWLAQHNAYGEKHPIVEGASRQVGDKAIEGRAFVLSIGSGLMKSGRPTILAGRRNRLAAFETSGGESDPLSTQLQITARQNQRFVEPSPVALERLQIPEQVSGDRDLRGRVDYRVSGTTSGNLALRMTFMLDGVTHSHYYRLDPLQNRGTIEFELDAVFGGQEHPPSLVVLLFELCELGRPNEKAKDLVLSEPVIRPVHVYPGDNSPEDVVKIHAME